MARRMSDAKRVLCIGSGWIAGRLAAHAAKVHRWSCAIAFQNFRNPAIAPDQLVAMPRTHTGWADLCRNVRPDYVVYLLGTSFVPEIEGNLKKAIDDNVVTLSQLLEAIVACSVPVTKLLIIGSASVYGPSDSALREDAPVAPTDPYGMLKLVQERVALSFFERRALPVLVVRQFNTSGVGQDRRFLLPSIAAQVAQALRDGRRALKLRIGDTGVKRDFLGIGDAVEGYCTLLKNAAAGSAYNVCSGVAYSVAEVAQRACRLFGLEVEFDVQADLVRKGERRRPVVLGDAGRLRSLGWQPRMSVDELIRGMVEAELVAQRS
jgi:nucleoside-diphosphate-sugar epimerase